jgi:putative hydrolase of the HAD superfamily
MIKALIFDMDGTLYKSNIIRTKFAEAAYHTLAIQKSLSYSDAKHAIECERERLKTQYGKSVPYTLTLRSFGVPIEVWHRHNIAFFDPRDFLKPDLALQKSLSSLKAKYKLAVLTNNNHTQSERTLEALGINRLFDALFTFNSFSVLKPDPAFFRQAVEYLNIPARACCYIGDRYDIDLKPAKEVGMSALEVTGPEDLYDLQHRLEQGD